MKGTSDIIMNIDDVIYANNTDRFNENSAENTEGEILKFVQNIVNGYAKAKAEYIQFMYCETVTPDELLSVLNSVRLFQKLYAGSKDIIDRCVIMENSDEFPTLVQTALTVQVKELKAKTNDTLRSIQKAYNESLDIDDDEEYNRVQSELREKRKKFRVYDEMLSGWIYIIDNYSNISVKPDLGDEAKTAVISAHESTAFDNESVDYYDAENSDSFSSDDELSGNYLEDDEPEADTNEQQTMQELSETVVDDGQINLKLGGNSITTFDYSDALCKVCEFVIDRAPFKMARITEQNIRLNSRTAFYRKPIPIEGYSKLSNGLQVIGMKSLSELKTMIKEIQRCCRINVGTITVVC